VTATISSRVRSFVGREAELQVLTEAGHGGDIRVVCLHGIAGMGKSALLRSFLESARAGGASVNELDCRTVEPTERGFLHAVVVVAAAVAAVVQRERARLHDHDRRPGVRVPPGRAAGRQRHLLDGDVTLVGGLVQLELEVAVERSTGEDRGAQDARAGCRERCAGRNRSCCRDGSECRQHLVRAVHAVTVWPPRRGSVRTR
jgi:hypothetical protein